MKTLNPFGGPGSLQAERQQRRRRHFKVVVWAIVGANVVLFLGMLIQGCGDHPARTETSDNQASEAIVPDTNGTAVAQQKAESDLPVPPPFEPATTSGLGATDTVTTAAASPAQAPAPVGTKQYAVLKGDSFSRIAKANHVSVKKLMDANPGVESTKLQVGQVLQLPVGAEVAAAVSTSAPTTADDVASAPAPSRTKAGAQYVVKSGDSLSRIARTHGTTVKAIKAANGLTGDRIVAGQKLKLPGSRTAGTARARG